MKKQPTMPAMQITKQLAIFLDNRPGMLARVCDALAREDLNILALATSDTVDHTVIRLVVNDPRKALHLFEEHGALVVDDDVLMIEADHKPGSLAAIARRLARAGINIEYCYCAASPANSRGSMVLRVCNAAKALRVLKRR
jgi:hypothetical protein